MVLSCQQGKPGCLRPAIRERQLFFDQWEGFRFDTPPGALLPVDFKTVLSPLLPADDGIVHNTADLPQLLLLRLRQTIAQCLPVEQERTDIVPLVAV